MLVDIFKKAFNILRYMITEDKIAAAQIAQIFGSELSFIDDNTTHRSNATPRATQIDPKKILLDDGSSSINSELSIRRQKEAEIAFPLDSQYSISPSSSELPVYSNSNQGIASSTNSEQIEKLCSLVERIVDILENSDVVIKGKNRSRKN